MAFLVYYENFFFQKCNYSTYMFSEISAELGLGGEKSFYVVVTSRIAWFAQCALSVGTKWGGDKTQSQVKKL